MQLPLLPFIEDADKANKENLIKNLVEITIKTIESGKSYVRVKNLYRKEVLAILKEKGYMLDRR